MRKPRERAGPRRRGAALLVAMVCLVILTAIAGSLARKAVTRRARRKAEERRVQAEWLARSGLERAWVKLSASPDYHGESWKVSPEDLEGPDSALVVITVAEVAGKPTRLVRVVADYPPDESRRARHTLQLELVPGGNASGEKP
jgi:Tfp pilus assembly protein PilX